MYNWHDKLGSARPEASMSSGIPARLGGPISFRECLLPAMILTDHGPQLSATPPTGTRETQKLPLGLRPAMVSRQEKWVLRPVRMRERRKGSGVLNVSSAPHSQRYWIPSTIVRREPHSLLSG